MPSPFSIYKYSISTAALFLSINSFGAESFEEYVNTCKQVLGISTMPGYTCDSNTWPVASEYVDSPNDLFILQSLQNNYLGRVTLSEDPNIDAIFLCRGTNENETALNGYILQHRITGEACFFDKKRNPTGQHATNTKTAPDLDSPTAGDYWADPVDMDGTCHDCHANDAYIVSPGIADAFNNLNIIENGRNLIDYSVVGSDNPSSHFNNWNQEIQSAIADNTTTCENTCHRLSSTKDIDT